MYSPQLTIIGLDAATFDVIDALIARGDLPNLTRLISAGSAGVLRSTTHPLTPNAWTTMVTGVNAGRHGIWDFTERDETGYQLRIVNGSHRRAAAIWDRLQAAGKRCGLVNVPFTWPAPRVAGFALAGFDAADRERGMTYPEEMLPELRRRFGALQLDHRFPLGKNGLDLERVRRAAEQKVEITLSLAQQFTPDLLFVVFMAADHVQHLGWAEWEAAGPDSAVAETYRILDQAVGRLVEAAEGSDVLLVSDHGAGRLDGVVNLNAWLSQEGFLAYDSGGQVGLRAAERAFRLRRALPEGLRYALKQRLPGLRERLYSRPEYRPIDWARTRAFAYGTFGSIVVNTRGREAEGIVAPGAEYEAVRDEIVARAATLSDPAGVPLVSAIYRREELFDGPDLGRLPDLIVELRDYAWLGKGNLTDREGTLWDRIEIEGAEGHSYVGSHRREGIVVLTGPSAARRNERISAAIEDIAPTALYLLGQPLPAELEGRLLSEALDPRLLDSRPLEYDENEAEYEPGLPSASTGSEVEERLRGLGYIE
jgi:predicted AlkP superfamily phosphohydrolase/phosphomutase